MQWLARPPISEKILYKMKELFILRSISGAGKSTVANMITHHVFEADQFFYDEDGNYRFDASKLGVAHETCRLNTEKAMSNGAEIIAVANTFSTEKELNPYFKLAMGYGYRAHSLIVENRHEGKDIHRVPEEVKERMRKRFSICL